MKEISGLKVKLNYLVNNSTKKITQWETYLLEVIPVGIIKVTESSANDKLGSLFLRLFGCKDAKIPLRIIKIVVDSSKNVSFCLAKHINTEYDAKVDQKRKFFTEHKKNTMLVKKIIIPVVIKKTSNFAQIERIFSLVFIITCNKFLLSNSKFSISLSFTLSADLKIFLIFCSSSFLNKLCFSLYTLM